MKYSTLAKRQRRKEFLQEELPPLLALIGAILLYAAIAYCSYL